MEIGFEAFKNCISLKEIDFHKCNEVIETRITKNDQISNLDIIVPDQLYDEYCKVNRVIFIKKYSDKIQEKIDNLKNSNILQAIIKLQKLNIEEPLNKNINQIINYFIKKYNIIKYQIDQCKNLLKEKEEVKQKVKVNGS